MINIPYLLLAHPNHGKPTMVFQEYWKYKIVLFVLLNGFSQVWDTTLSWWRKLTVMLKKSPNCFSIIYQQPLWRRMLIMKYLLFYPKSTHTGMNPENAKWLILDDQILLLFLVSSGLVNRVYLTIQNSSHCYHLNWKEECHIWL